MGRPGWKECAGIPRDRLAAQVSHVVGSHHGRTSLEAPRVIEGRWATGEG